jgi:lipoate-protein ligase B
MRFSRSDDFQVLDLGRTTYEHADKLMLELVDRIVADDAPDHLLLAEFDPVLTVGRGAGAEAYAEVGLPVHEIARGGKATFHGPGQIVAYPLIKLHDKARDLHAYLHALEEGLIRAVSSFDLPASRDPRNTGCWIDGHKVASIGVAVRKWVTYHGIALNVSTDLSWFRRFDPCGLEPDLMTSMERASHGQAPDMEMVKQAVAKHLQEVLREQI